MLTRTVVTGDNTRPQRKLTTSPFNPSGFHPKYSTTYQVNQQQQQQQPQFFAQSRRHDMAFTHTQTPHNSTSCLCHALHHGRVHRQRWTPLWLHT